jgi:hypothetical protein
LLEIPFFKRLRKYISIKEFFEMIPNLKLIEKKLGDIVFLDDSNVYMVVNGRILLRYHEEDPLEFQYIAQYMQGKVLGHPTIDGGVSLMG